MKQSISTICFATATDIGVSLANVELITRIAYYAGVLIIAILTYRAQKKKK